MGGAASKSRSPESERREAARRRTSERSFLRLRALWSPGSGDPQPAELGRPDPEPRVALSALRALVAREVALRTPECYALGPGKRRRRRRTAFQGPLPRPRPPTCPRPRPPPNCAQWVHSFLPVTSTNIYGVPTGCGAPGCGGRSLSQCCLDSALPSGRRWSAEGIRRMCIQKKVSWRR